MSIKFSLKLLYSTICGKNFQIFKIPRKCTKFPELPTQNSPPSSCHHALGRRIPLCSIPPKICFPPTAEKGGRNYDLLYQNSVRKYEDDLEH